MSEKRKKKTVVIPEGPISRDDSTMLALVDLHGGDDDGRDVSKPLAYDENGNAIYAPRGIVFRIP